MSGDSKFYSCDVVANEERVKEHFYKVPTWNLSSAVEFYVESVQSKSNEKVPYCEKTNVLTALENLLFVMSQRARYVMVLMSGGGVTGLLSLSYRPDPCLNAQLSFLQGV